MMMKPKTNDANEIRLYKARGGLPMRPLNRDEALRVIAIDCGWTLQYTATSLKDGETAELIRIATFHLPGSSWPSVNSPSSPPSIDTRRRA